MTELMNPANQPNMVPDFGTQDPTQTEIVYMPVPMPSAEDYADSILVSSEDQPQSQEVALAPIDDDTYYEQRDEAIEQRNERTIQTLVATAGGVQSFEDRSKKMISSMREGAEQIRAEQIDQIDRSTKALITAIERIRRDRIAGVQIDYEERVQQIEAVEDAALAFTGIARQTQSQLEVSTQQMDSQHEVTKGRRTHAIAEHNGGVDLVGTLGESREQTMIRIDELQTNVEGARGAIEGSEAYIRERETEGVVLRRRLEQETYARLRGNAYLTSREIDDQGTQVVDQTSLNRALELAVQGQESLELSEIRADVESARQSVASHRRAEAIMLDTQAREQLNLTNLEQEIDEHTNRVLGLAEKVEVLRGQGGKIDEYSQLLEELSQRFQWILDSDVVTALHQQNVPKQLQPVYEKLTNYLGAMYALTNGEAGLTSEDLEVRYEDRVPLGIEGNGGEIAEAAERLELEEKAYELLQSVAPQLRLNSFMSGAKDALRRFFKHGSEVTYTRVETED